MERPLLIEPTAPGPSDAAPVLIATRRRAVVAMCFAGYFAGGSFWSLLNSHRAQGPGWIFPFNSFWPNWVEASLDLWIYGFMIWLLVVACTRLKNEERVFFAVWIAEILVSPFNSLLPASFAAAVPWLKWFGDIVMLVAAAIIYRNIQHSDTGGPESDPMETPSAPDSTSWRVIPDG